MHAMAKSGVGSGNGRPFLGWGALVLLVVLMAFTFREGLAAMAGHWEREEYSHGYLIPLIAAFMVWRKRRELAELQWRGVWSGVFVIATAMIIMLLGELSTLYTIIQYAFILALAGVVLVLLGYPGLRSLWVPLLYLFFMIPLPNFLYNNLSQELQLVSSAIGVWFIRLFDISVFLEGNVIDLGIYQLQVVEACSGLRYLFPLMSFGFLCAYLYKARFWARAIVFLSSIPLTVLMNSFRIGVIGVLVEFWGIEQAEGFLHYFEGWVIFMACVVILFGEMWLLSRLTGDKRPFRDVFNLDFGDPLPSHASLQRGSVSAPLVGALVVLVATAVGLQFVSARAEVTPERQTFSDFPLRLGEWRGTQESLPANIVRVLKVSDYFLGNYGRSVDAAPVNLYVAYYESQRKGASIHSPRSCLPGHDWEINSLRQHAVGAGNDALVVNRVVISKGANRQLVYYWFEQRGRKLTSEYAVKGYLLWDAINKNRTDGALVRLTTPVPPGTSLKEADSRLQSFLEQAYGKLDGYIPT